MPSASRISSRTGWRALAHSRATFAGVSSPASVVRSIVVTALSSHAACQSFLTVRRVGIVVARRSVALRLTRISRSQSSSSAVPGLRAGCDDGAGLAPGIGVTLWLLMRFLGYPFVGLHSDRIGGCFRVARGV